MLRHKGTDPALNETGLSGEMLLIGAILRQAVCDARLDTPSQTSTSAHRQAKAFLMDQDAIDWWAGLVGANGDILGETLRRAARLE